MTERLENVQKSIDTIRSRDPQAEPPDDLQNELSLLKLLDLLYAQRRAHIDTIAELHGDLETLDEDLQSLRAAGPSDPKPYSYLLLDDTHSQLATEQARLKSIDMEIVAANASLGSARDSLAQAESERRLVKDSLESQIGSADNAKPGRELELARLQCRVLAEMVQQRLDEIEKTKLEQKISQVRVTHLREKIKFLTRATTFSRQDLQSRLDLLDKAEIELKANLADLQRELRIAQQSWLAAKREHEQSDAKDAVLVEQLAARQTAREAIQEEISISNVQLSELVVVRYVWNCRFKAANQMAEPEEILQWAAEVDQFLDRLRRSKQLLEIRLDEQRGDLAALERRLMTAQETDEEIVRWLRFHSEQRQRMINTYGMHLVLLKTAERLYERVQGEFSSRTKPTTASQWLDRTRNVADSLWNYELTSVDDRPITVRKLVVGVILLLTGVILSRVVSRTLGRRVLPRVGLNEGASLAFQTIAFYSMVATLTFVSLELVNMPITVFAFMGGVIAIGVGFGSQNVLNNFISGLILMAERPIRVGDLVDIDGLYGTIEHMGARSTRVKTGSNLEIIVPNSKFLENNVTNWTLSDTRIRAMVSVGVAYGSPTQEVQRLLRRAVTENPNVLEHPDPIVIFKEFGDNALHFEAHFWIHMRTVMEGERIESEIRHVIDEWFRRAGITIAFPQRDIHLDTESPIQVAVRALPEGVAELRKAA